MIGIDPHKGSHTASAIDQAETALGELRVRSGADQLGRLLGWAARWPERIWAVEGASGLGYLLAQQLVAAGEQVADVQPKLAARGRLLATGATNTNDPNDARSVAIAALRSPAVRKVGAENHAAVMRVWARRHRDLGSARTQVAGRLHAVLCALVPGGFAGEISAARAARLLDELQPDGAVAAARCDLARQFAADLRRIDEQMRDTRKRLAAAVTASRTTTTQIFGVGPVVAAIVIGEAGHITRFASRDHFAACNGTAPVEVSSGPRKIYRLSRRGNRRINHAIHMAAVTQIRHRHTDGRAYFERKLAEGKTRERSAAIAQAPHQRRPVRPPPGRRPPSRGNRQRGPGRATGERLCRQRGRLTPQAPAPGPIPRPGRQDHARREKPTGPLDNKEASICTVHVVTGAAPMSVHNGAR
jgi:transposase